MAWSQEAIIALVGVLMNLPTFGLVLWRMCRRRRNNSSASDLDDRGSNLPLLPPQRSTWDHAVLFINMAQHPNRQ